MKLLLIILTVIDFILAAVMALAGEQDAGRIVGLKAMVGVGSLAIIEAIEKKSV